MKASGDHQAEKSAIFKNFSPLDVTIPNVASPYHPTSALYALPSRDTRCHISSTSSFRTRQP